MNAGRRALTALAVATALIAVPGPATAVADHGPECEPGMDLDAAPFGSTPCPGVRPGAVVIMGAPPVLEGVLLDGYCTLGFVFEAAGTRYISTAGHCAGLGSEEREWAPGTGAAVFDHQRRRIGELSYAVTSGAGARGDLDFALIRLDPGVEADPEVCHFGGPFGIDDRVLPRGRPVRLHYYGNTVAGGYAPGTGRWILPARTGTSDGLPSASRIYFNGHASFADSGAPIVSRQGRALALLSGPGNIDADGYAGLVYAPRIEPQMRRAETILGVDLELVTAGGG